MNDLSKYLSELLIAQDCVIIPDFGAFIGNYQPAVINDNKITPPSKKIAFNSRLVSNDGLLYHYVSVKEKISYQDAALLVKSLVLKWNQSLNHGEVVRLNKIGELTKSADSKIIFTPYNSFNFLTDAYGFEEITIKPVERSRLILINSASYKQSGEKRKKVHHPNHKRILYYSLSFYLPVLAFLWGFFLIKEPFSTQMASIYPFYNDREVEVPVTNEQTVSKNTSAGANEKTDSEEKSSPKEIENTPQELLTRYYIIGGCFKDRKNAENYHRDLINKGYKQSELLEEGAFSRVSYNCFSERDSAIQYLQQIHQKENTSAWILNK